MTDELRRAFEDLAGRGTPQGAETVVARAVAEASGHLVVPVTPARRRRRPFRLAIAISVAAALVGVCAVGGGVLYARMKLDDIERVDLSAELAGSAAPSEPFTVLVVGSDSRAGLDPGDVPTFGSAEDVGAARADVLLVLRVDQASGRISALSLPRDLWVPIAGTGREQRINSALGEGAGALVETVQTILGIRLDHYVEVDFDGFRRVVDAVDGVTMRFDEPTRDLVTGLRVDMGCHVLDGDEALALVRSRHEQHLVDGRWVADPTGDLGRIKRQQRFLLALLEEVGATRNPLALARLLDVAADELTVDDGLSGDDLVHLSRQVDSFSPAGLRFVAVAVEAGRVNGASILRADPADLLAAGAALAEEPAAAPAVGSAGGGEAGAPLPACE